MKGERELRLWDFAAKVKDKMEADLVYLLYDLFLPFLEVYTSNHDVRFSQCRAPSFFGHFQQ